MEPSVDFKAYQDKLNASLVALTRTTNSIANQDLNFYRSASEEFSQSLDTQKNHFLRLANKILKCASRESTSKTPIFQNRDEVDDNWHRFVDIVDDLLEKADVSLDEYTGVLKRTSSPAVSDTPEPPAKRQRFANQADQWTHLSMPKPQLQFQRKVDNFASDVWKPLITNKPHGLKTLEESIGTGEGGYKHPYTYEIETTSYPTSLSQPTEPITFTPIDQSSAIFVDTEIAVQQMLQELKKATEIAIDLEHNDKNSYTGLVSLMQISTRENDWIVDTLKPWRENLQVLNEVFADPAIVKVFHGSTSDIIWLQRDLGLYIVNLFDTYHASDALHFPAKSLKYLLQRFANVEAQKQYQLADWRVRPLPKELLDYARSDTHYLLYIYDNLRNLLLEASTPDDNLIHYVQEASKKEALQVYERPIYDAEKGLGPGGWLRLLMSRNTGFDNGQFAVFKALHQWRDHKARLLDEGVEVVLPNSLLFTLAQNTPLRKSQFFNRGIGRLPQAIVDNIDELCEVNKKAYFDGKDKGPSIYDAIAKNGDKVGNMFGRNKYQKKPQQTTQPGVGATLQMLNQNGEVKSSSKATSVYGTEIDSPIVHRAAISSLFGSVNLSPEQVRIDPAVFSQALQTVLPLNLSQAHLQVPSAIHLPPHVDAPTSELPILNPVLDNQPRPSHDDQDHIMTPNDLGKKRKADDTFDPEGNPQLEDEETNVTQHETTHDEIDTSENERRQVKHLKKEEKKAKKAAEAAEKKAAQENLKPFDYASANSILHAETDASSAADKEKKSGAKPLNPFARAMDTSTGAKRSKMGKELAGKSHTFSS